MALAIELAAARYSTLGMDGLEGALDERLRFLIGGNARSPTGIARSRRHRLELRAPRSRRPRPARRRLRAGFLVRRRRRPRPSAGRNAQRATVADGLARLAGDSLLVVQRGEPTRYRALETIRQYGVEQLAAAGELGAIRAHHKRWCRAEMDDAPRRQRPTTHGVRSSIGWSTTSAPRCSGRPPTRSRRSESASLAADLAALLFVHGRPAEAQRRYEQAAELTPIDARRADYLRLAAGRRPPAATSATRRSDCSVPLPTWRPHSATEPRLLTILPGWRSISSGPPGSWSTSRLSTKRLSAATAPGRCRTGPSTPRRRSPRRRRAAVAATRRSSTGREPLSTSPIEPQTRSPRAPRSTNCVPSSSNATTSPRPWG